MLLGKVISQWSLRGHRYARSDQFPTGQGLKSEKKMAGWEAISFKWHQYFSATRFPSHFQGETKRKKKKKKRRGRDSDWIVSQVRFCRHFFCFSQTWICNEINIKPHKGMIFTWNRTETWWRAGGLTQSQEKLCGGRVWTSQLRSGLYHLLPG